MKKRNIARLTGGMTVVLLATALVVGVPGVAAGKKAAKKTSGVAYVGVTHAEGEDLYVSGDLKDSLLGRGAIVYVTRIGGSDEPGTFLVKARKITIYTKKGSLSGKGQALQTLEGDGTTTVHDGTFKLTKGTGKYKGHKMKGTFGGTYDEGVYTFDYDAKYK